MNSPVKPKLLDQVREKIRVKHYSLRTEKSYVHWIRRFILFHGKRHPAQLRMEEVNGFLTYLAAQREVAASTQNQALNAILFLYEGSIESRVGLARVLSAPRGRRACRWCCRWPSVLVHLDGAMWLMASLLCGAGLRLMEGLGASPGFTCSC